ncbi:hypothetical protein DBR11_00730 [Pedobacter sp. HMWF019]|uniref:OmpA family protein n=1 Tax=Pedobacter sp. HMWF019 TaxID=2056856 RepID=UPI000D379641|nr:OmpA family protein [Pedobacter sp. HMWF019]PTT04041.1 hypothetical protein DBR11_00730 [Pedobacter sp. HMWF019]
MKLKLLCIAMMCLSVMKIYAQDPRVSQYNSIPLLVNPAQTGDFEGRYRILGLASKVYTDVSENYFYNASLDYRIGKSGSWAVGLNYLQSGSKNFPVNGRYYGLSVAKGIFLDQAHVQELRLGAQASYIKGHIDQNKGSYDRFLDVGAFRHEKRSVTEPNYIGDVSYLNYSIGAKYLFTLDRLKVQTGFSAYNITNPEYNFLYKGSLLKRYRVTALTSLFYQVNPKNGLKVEQYSWKEGVFLRDYKAKRDTAGIHETTYGLTWMRFDKENVLSLGLFTRSWQSGYVVAGMNLSDRWGLSASYEVPFLKSYYDVSHLELGISFYPFRKKAPKSEVPDRMNRQIQALLPFGTSFCSPCPDPKMVMPMPVKVQPVVPEKPSDSIPKNKDLPEILKSNEGAGLLYKDTIYYNLDKYNIRPDAREKLDRIGSLMRRFDFLSLQVQSHTDLRANAVYNQRLSENRAGSVEAYLMGAGISPDKITKTWFGKSKPIYNCASCDEIKQEKNRRSELSLYGFNEDNMKALLKTKFFGDEVQTLGQLREKIKQLVVLDQSGSETPVLTQRKQNETGYYTVQIGAFKDLENNLVVDLKGFRLFNEKGEDGFRRYFYGVFGSKEEAQEALVKLKGLGLKEAFIRSVNVSLK